MQFPSRELTNQYISTSYQDVLQQYPLGSLFYVLDGLGNVVSVLNSSSLGDLLITSNMTASMLVASASYAVTYSYSYIVSSSTSETSSYSYTSSNSQYSQLSFESLFSDTSSYSIYSIFSDTASIAAESFSSSYALSASWAPGGGTSLISGSTYPITSSWSYNAITASYVANMPSGSNVSSSYALTASYALNGGSSGLNIPSYDYSYLTYNGPLGQVSDCTYKIGGSSGTIVCIVTALYSGDIFIGVSKSFG